MFNLKFNFDHTIILNLARSESLDLIHDQARLVSESIENSHPSDVEAAKHAKQIWELLVALYGRLPDSLFPTGKDLVLVAILFS